MKKYIIICSGLMIVLSTGALFGDNATPCAKVGDTRIQVAEVVVPGEIIEPELGKIIVSLRETLAQAQTRSKSLCARAEWQWVTKLQTAIDGIAKDIAAGDIADAYQKAISWRVGYIRRNVEQLIIAAIPFTVIGPFGDKKFADAAHLWKYPGRNELDMPWLQEFETPPTAARTQLSELFNPDFNKTHKGFEGRAVRWHERWKIGTLTFADTSAEAPYWSVSYAYVEVYSPERRRTAIWLSGDVAGLMGWINGKPCLYCPPIKYRNEWGPPALPGGVGQGGFYFEKGWNRLLFKVLHRHNTRLDFGILYCRARIPMLDLQFRTPLESVGKDK